MSNEARISFYFFTQKAASKTGKEELKDLSMEEGEAELCILMPLHPDQSSHNYTERCRHTHVAASMPSMS